MGKIISVLFTVCMLFILPGCSGTEMSIPSLPETSSAQEKDESGTEPDITDPSSSAEPSQVDAAGDMLVVYFSCTGNTKSAAERIAGLCSADIYEIVPAEPYTSSDLSYNDDNCRANREMNDESARPEIGSQAIDLSEYETVFIGYPIWWGTMPRIINTFLDTYDLSGKTVMPFCTSGSSGISSSVSDMRNAEPEADVRNGLRISGADDSEIEAWINENGV